MNNRKLLFIAAASLVIVVTACFSPVFRAQFVNYDDDKMVYQNPKITELSPQSVKLFFTSDYVGLYHPLVLLSYAIEHRFFRLDPAPYHVTNLCLHLCSTLLVLWIAWMLSANVWVAFITALLFGIHPLHVESVAWVSERKDVLYAFFFLSSFAAYLSYRKKGSLAYYGASVVLFVMSLLSKPMAITLPLVLCLADFLTKRTWDRKAFIDKIVFFALAALFAAATVMIHYTSGEISPRPPFAFWQKIFVAAYGFVFYIGKMLFPVKLSCIYPYPEDIYQRMPLLFLLSPLIAGTLFGLAAYSLRKTRVAAFGLLFYLVTVAPVLQFFPAGGEAVPADRYTYIPLLGLFYVIGAGIAGIASRAATRRFIVPSVIAVFLILAALTYRRCAVWHDSISLWDDVLKTRPRAALAYSNRGAEYFLRKDYDRALADLRNALAINPNAADVYNNRGVLYNEIGDFGRAVADFTQAIALKPGISHMYDNRGLAYYHQGDRAEALEDFTEAIRLDPRNCTSHNNRGILLSDNRDYKAAIADYDTAVRIAPRYADAYHNRAVAYFYMNDFDSAWRDLHKVRELGDKPTPRFLELLRQASGRNE
ncbi:MAG TPA: tetratricopeptide repeat protein [bacterium]|nr:tetratricopeptide repeat protein [bacterium]